MLLWWRRCDFDGERIQCTYLQTATAHSVHVYLPFVVNGRLLTAHLVSRTRLYMQLHMGHLKCTRHEHTKTRLKEGSPCYCYCCLPPNLFDAHIAQDVRNVIKWFQTQRRGDLKPQRSSSAMSVLLMQSRFPCFFNLLSTYTNKRVTIFTNKYDIELITMSATIMNSMFLFSLPLTRT